MLKLIIQLKNTAYNSEKEIEFDMDDKYDGTQRLFEMAGL